MMRNMTLAIETIALMGSIQYCSAYTWNILNLTGKPARVKIKLACLGKGPENNNVPPATTSKEGLDTEKYDKTDRTPLSGKAGCCISGIEVNGKDVTLRALSKQQATAVLIGALSSAGAAMSVSAGATIAATLIGAAAPLQTGIITAAGATIEVPPVAIGIALAGLGLALAIPAITEGVARCKSRDLIVAQDGAFLVIEPDEEPEEIAHQV